MALKLEDLGINSRAVMRALAEQPHTRRALADKTGLSVMQSSRTLNRLSVFGLVNHPETPGNAWSLSANGYALLNATPLQSDVHANVPPEPVQNAEEPAGDTAKTPPETTPERSTDDTDDPAVDSTVGVPEPLVPPPPRAEPDQIAADLLAAMEIEVALDHVRTKLRSSAIPARAQRVYREVLTVLPPTLVEALEPITTLVAAHNLQ